MGTYSEQTLQCYAKMIADYVSAGKNITTAAMNETAILYGYPKLDVAERRLAETASPSARTS